MTNQLRLCQSFAIIFAGYGLSTAATVAAMPALYGTACRQAFLTSSCALRPDSAAQTGAYLALALSGLLLATALFIWGRRLAAYPFLMIMLVLAGTAGLCDLLIGQPVINSPKIINDTINILGAVMAASFSLVVVLVREWRYSMLDLARAVAISFGVKVLSISAFVEMSLGTFGVTEMLLLYVMYAFGCFTLHLMMISSFVASLRPATARGAVS